MDPDPSGLYTKRKQQQSGKDVSHSQGVETTSSIGHVRYIIILTWLRGFRVKLLYLVLFSLYLSLFWELKDKRNLKNLQF